ncbi:MAG: glutathione S-transferase family protein [Proteobacteria bacterium]|nr:glutathione S-transferase family protein [Pseudomonadota bacterium]
MREDSLYCVEGSYYAAKIRAYLMCKGIPFRERLADRKAFAEQIIPRVGYAIVPVIVTADDATLQDTALMIDYYEQRNPTPEIVPRGARLWFVSYLLELLADEWIKLPALHYRWAYNHDFAVSMMGHNNDPSWPLAKQQEIGAKIAAKFSRWPHHLGVTESTRAAVEASYLELLNLLDRHFEAHPFILGDVPSFGDCALAGPLYAHLYHDPNSGKMMHAHAPHVHAWARRIRHVKPVAASHSYSKDEFPDSLTPVLIHLGRDYARVVAAAIPLIQQWLEQHDETDIPTYVGQHEFTVGHGKPYEARGVRSLASFEAWKVQRLMDLVSRQPQDVRRTIEALGVDLEIEPLLSLTFPQRLEYRNFKLVRA